MKLYNIIYPICIVALAIGVCFSSCKRGGEPTYGKPLEKTELVKGIAIANEQCPLDLEGIGTMESVELSGDTVIYNFTLDEEFDANANDEAMHDRMINSALANERKSLEMFNDNGISLRYVFTTPSDKRIIVIITKDEIEEALSRNVSSSEAAEEVLMSELASTKSTLPVNMGSGMTMTDVIMNDKNLIYVCTVDESLYSLSEEDFDRSAAKSAIKKELASPNITEQAMIRNLVNTNRNVVYRYVGNKSGKNIEVVISHNELRDFL